MPERRAGRLRQALIAGTAIAALVAGLARAQQIDISVPAQPLSQTLKDISRQTGDNILFTPESVTGLRAPALSGKMTSFDAVNRALSGTDLEAVPDGSGGLVVRRTAQKKTILTEHQPAETVIVTGSRIPQIDITANPSPVTVVGRQEFEFAGTTDVTTLINSLPQVFASQNANLSNGATGTDNVNLRDLGPSRTLVLIDGSRLMPGDPADPAADINVVPATLVDHIEILTGGASAVYGSDALAGVVNFIMRRDFEGIEADGTYSITQNDNDTARWRNLIQGQINLGVPGFAEPATNVWNGATEDATLIMGVNSDNGKGNISAFLGYRSVAAVLESTRDYSECSLYWTGTRDICQGSQNYNAWLSLDDYYGGGPDSGYYFQTGTGKPGSGQFVPFTYAPNQSYNFAFTNYFQRPDTRYTGGFFAHYDVDNRFKLFADLMIMDDHTVAQIAPSGIFLGSGIGPDNTIYVNCSNPFMTAQENYLLCGALPGDALTTIGGRTFWNGAGNSPARTGNPDAVAGQANVYVGRRDIEGGERRSELRHTAYRMKIGASGEFGSDWTYNLYAQEGYTQYSNISTGDFSTSRVQNALEVDPVTGQCYAAESGLAPTCVPLDIFNGIGSITPAMQNYVAAAAMQQGWTQEQVASGSMTGDLGEWGIKSSWARDAAVAVLGAEYRQEMLAYSPDEEFRSGDIEGVGAPILAVPPSGFSVAEGFTELQLPVIQNTPAIEDLTLKGGYRFSSYSRAGDTDTWYGAADWQPMDDFRFRASMQHAVRAPNVVELFTPPQVLEGLVSSYPDGDPCATITTGQCASVPNHGTKLLVCPGLACNEQVGGNPFLKPESSNTRTAGIVLTPSFLDGFTATVDWWNIDVTGYISTSPAQQILDECYGPHATPGSAAFFCPFVHRAPNGILYGPGYVADVSVNTGYLKTSGVDFSLNWQADTADWFGVHDGTLTFNLIGTWLDTLVNEAVPATPLTAALVAHSSYNCAGLFGTICGDAPKWRHKFRVTWATPFDVQVSLQWRYNGAVSLDADTSTRLIGGGPGLTQCGSFTVAGLGDCADAHISSYSYFDLAVAWTVRSGVELRAGANNIFDIEPPVLSDFAVPLSTGNGNTFTGGYDVLGRTLFCSVTVKY
ncbi:MAG TPA: TonB-dependent receptor [Rhizomicrobium sp.]|jgi:outer membrane receptor protein involved in Fe transport|nr:TonB-dependent receptor [Rhizomicrobium sp.]